MTYPSWNDLNNKYGNDACNQFENLCRVLFCKEKGIEPRTLVAVKNQPGNETEVVLCRNEETGEEELIGFQCKYLKAYSLQVFIDSVTVAKNHNPDQKVIYLYSNIEIPSTTAKDKLIEEVQNLGMRCEPRFNNQILDQVIQENQGIYDFFFRLIPNDEKVFRPYENELSVGENKKFLEEASENLIENHKVYRNDNYINRVKQYLNDKKFCLIKAPEGRGKTFLSRIIAYDYHHQENMKVYFLDFKKQNSISVNKIEDEIQKWKKYTHGEYLLVFENVHAYENLNELIDLIKEIDPKENRFRFLLNARPTDVELEDFSDWEEIVELNPDNEDVNEIIDLFSAEVRREPFADDVERSNFLKKINTKKKKSNGANLRLLKIYLETWQNHPEIRFISDVSEEKIIEDFKLFYLKDKNRRRPTQEVEALWFISSLYQFDVPVLDVFVQNVGNLVSPAGLLRFEDNKYHLPHSVDASFLFKAICDYKHKNCDDQMEIFAKRFVNDILYNDNPKDFENDFKMLISGLLARKDNFKKVIYYIVGEDIAKEIIEKINPGFVLTFFRPGNHEFPNTDKLFDYYKNNKKWLIPKILELSAAPVCFVYKTFKKHLKKNIVKDIFEKPSDLDDYLGKNYNYKLLFDPQLLIPIAKLGKGYITILKEHYKNNKASLKLLFLGLSATRLAFVSIMAFKKHLNKDIAKDIFEDTKDLDDYLRADNNYKLLCYDELMKDIAQLGEGYITILKKHYKNNKVNLKPLLLGLSITSFVFVNNIYKKYLHYDIAKDIFVKTNDLDDYFRASENYELLLNNQLIKSIAKLGVNHKTILINHYMNSKALLKPLFLKINPSLFGFAYIAYKNYLNYDIVKDIFEDTKDLDDYLRNNDGKKFQHDDVYLAIELLGDKHIQVLEKHNAYYYFFYTKYTKGSIAINQVLINQFWSKKKTFDVCRILNKGFYFDGVSWAYLQKFVSIIKDNMTDENREQSRNMVKAIIKMVFDKKNALSYATTVDLAYFYFNILSVDESLFDDLKENDEVTKDVKRRLSVSSYCAGDFHLFGLFFSLSWCKDILEQRILNADDAQRKTIIAWHDKLIEKLKERGEEINTGSLLDYVHTQVLDKWSLASPDIE